MSCKQYEHLELFPRSSTSNLQANRSRGSSTSLIEDTPERSKSNLLDLNNNTRREMKEIEIHWYDALMPSIRPRSWQSTRRRGTPVFMTTAFEAWRGLAKHEAKACLFGFSMKHDLSLRDGGLTAARDGRFAHSIPKVRLSCKVRVRVPMTYILRQFAYFSGSSSTDSQCLLLGELHLRNCRHRPNRNSLELQYGFSYHFRSKRTQKQRYGLA